MFTSNAARCPTIRRYVESVGANFGRVRMIKLEPQDHDDGDAVASTATTTTASTPTSDGWVVRSWLELTDNPDSYMLLMECGPDGLPDPRDRDAAPAPPRRSLRRRHPAPLARRGPPERRRPLRARSRRSNRARRSTAWIDGRAAVLDRATAEQRLRPIGAVRARWCF